MTDEPPHRVGDEAALARCDRCGRAVRETMHERSAYAVDAFVLHTGPTEPAVLRRPDSETVVLAYQRLVRPVVLVTCIDCYGDPVGRRRHQSWTYPPEDADAD